jgi:hypothetical protein
VLNYSRHVAELAREGGRILDGSEAAVQDVVIFVGEVGLAVWGVAEFYFCAQGFDSLGDQGLGEFDYFYWQGEFAQHWDSFGCVYHHYELFGGGGYDFFAEERAASAFDQLQVGVDFVGAVDGYVDVLAFVECGQRDAEARGLVALVVGAGDAADFQALINLFG